MIRKFIKSLLLAVLLCSPALAAGEYGDVIVSQVTSIYDGDTIICTIKGWPAIIGERVSVRIKDIDTPELDDERQDIKERARLAKVFTVTKVRAAKVIELRNMQRDKYFRILADVYLDGKSLGEMLIAEGLAKEYDGGKKE